MYGWKASAQCHVIEQLYSHIQLIYYMYKAPLFTLPHPQMQYVAPECRLNENEKYAIHKSTNTIQMTVSYSISNKQMKSITNL